MEQLEEATRRLQSAVDRLDRAVLARAGRGATDLDELRQALQRKSEENARLQAVTAEAGERIDGAIGRLKSLLGE